MYNLFMDLQSYLKLTHLLENDDSQKEERRAFFLKHQMQKLSDTKQLLFWMDKASHNAPQHSSHLKSITNILFFLSFIFGLFSAVALLSYHGEHPVNIIYLFVIAVVIPIVSMLLSLFALFFPRALTPFFLTTWTEKIIAKFVSTDNPLLKLDADIKYTFSLFIVQVSALLFSTGLLLGFLAVIFTQDIAFGWSTTLHITTQSFYNFLHSLSFVFEAICPQSAVSLELIQETHYFRLGGHITQEMQRSASLFGEWWKFLACSTLFYAIFLRLLFLLFTFIKLRKTVSKALSQIEGAQELLRDMNEPLISTTADTKEQKGTEQTTAPLPTKETLTGYYAALGWAFNQEELLLILDALHLTPQQSYTVGGNKSLKEDSSVISLMQGDTLLLVKAWEVPTMEFIDFVEELLPKVKSLRIYPTGYAKEHYRADPEDLAIWEQKIAAQNLKNVSIQK